MSNYRPICDTWILARPKVKYYGAYPAGFLGRARQLVGASIDEPVLHVCSGKVLQYPYRGLGPLDRTLDVDPVLEPDFLQDARKPWPTEHNFGGETGKLRWKAILADPPYSEDDCAEYACGREAYPNPSALIKRAFEVLESGQRIGILHYLWPRPPKDAISVAVVSVLVGFGNRGRLFSVFEKR